MPINPTVVRGLDIDMSDGTPHRVVINKFNDDANPALNVNNYAGTGPVGRFQNPDGSIFDIPACLPPIGSIIPFYDYNGALTFDLNFWAYCNGQSKVIAGISRTLPDLSNRYLVGFGTENGGDIGSATWTTTPVGNANHQVNLQHSHTVNSHGHSMQGHSHDMSHIHSFSVASHRHSIGSDGGHNHYGPPQSGPSGVYLFSGVAPGFYPILDGSHNHSGITAYNSTYNSTTDGASSGSTSGPSISNTGDNSPETNNQLSTSQSIQPRSMQVRYLMRIK